MAPAIRRSSAFSGPATAQRPRRRSSNDLCESCGHFRSEHRSGQNCRRDDCPCPEMGWTSPTPVRLQTKTVITDEVKAQMESLLKAGMNYRKVAAAVGCSHSSVKRYFPGYGHNGLVDAEINREIYKQRQRKLSRIDHLRKDSKS